MCVCPNPVTTLANATHNTLTQALTAPHSILHFNGHAGYNPTDPKRSGLALQGDDILTTLDLYQLPHRLHSYNLICLTACETAITGPQSITSEYVGITSGFLAHGIPHVLSTLWTIADSPATMLFVLQFYRHLLKGHSPSQALTHSQTWLKTVTTRQLHRHYTHWIDRLPNSDRLRAFLKTERAKLGTMEPNQAPYSHPYYWAAFILSGRS
jgi:CHAT domain-containing protein